MFKYKMLKLLIIYLSIYSVTACNLQELQKHVMECKLYPQHMSKQILANYNKCNNDKLISYGILGLLGMVVAAPLIAPAFAAAGLYGAAAYSSGLAALGGGAIAAGGAGMAGGMIVLAGTGMLSGAALSRVGINKCMKESIKCIPHSYNDIMIVKNTKYVGEFKSTGELQIGIPQSTGLLYTNVTGEWKQC